MTGQRHPDILKQRLKMGKEIMNPYIDEIRKLVIETAQINDEEKKKRLAELQEKSRMWTQDRLTELTEGYTSLTDTQFKAKIKSNFPSLGRQYKEACDTYKLIMKLVYDSRALKKSLREEIELKKRT